MDRLRALRTFIAVAENASFAEAGRKLRLSPTTVTRIIATLEQAAGAPLLARTTRSVRLTDDGAQFLHRCRAALAEIDDAFDTIRGSRQEPQGTLRITAPVMFGRLHVLPIVTELLRLHPALQVRLVLLDRVANMIEEEIDVAVRIGDPPDSALHLLKIGEVHTVLSASPDYLHRHGEPATRADLHHHSLIEIEDERGRLGGWQADAAKGLPPMKTRLSVNSMDAGIGAAVAGLGVVRSLSYQVAEHLAAGRLVRLLPTEPTTMIPVSLLFQSGRRDTPNIRAFLELARERLRQE